MNFLIIKGREVSYAYDLREILEYKTPKTLEEFGNPRSIVSLIFG